MQNGTGWKGPLEVIESKHPAKEGTKVLGAGGSGVCWEGSVCSTVLRAHLRTQYMAIIREPAKSQSGSILGIFTGEGLPKDPLQQFPALGGHRAMARLTLATRTFHKPLLYGKCHHTAKGTRAVTQQWADRFSMHKSSPCLNFPADKSVWGG